MPPVVSVVVLAFGEEPHLRACIDAVLASDPSPAEVVVVDNGAAAAVASLPVDERLRVVSEGSNLGYAGGCNLGARRATGDILVFVNSDAVVEPEAVGALSASASGSGTTLVCGCVLLADDPTQVNAVGNPVHFSGMAWAGGFGEPAEEHTAPGDVTSITGALFAASRKTWETLGGFDPLYFAYHEDVEMSLRAWHRGGRVRYVPQARAVHHYSFHRNPEKLFLLERNRLMTVLTTYPAPLLGRLTPALVIFELVMCGTALVQGWLPSKLRGYAWLLRHRAHIRNRRRDVQREAVLGPRAFADLLRPALRPANFDAPPGLSVLNLALGGLFRLALLGLPATRTPTPHEAG